MDIGDGESPTQGRKQADLELMSIEALEEYKAELQAEIARVDAVIARKKGHRSAADRLFGKP